MEPVHFYACRNKYGCFSNFKIGSIMMDGKAWRSAEHWFVLSFTLLFFSSSPTPAHSSHFLMFAITIRYQAQKYAGTPHVERIRLMKRAQEAFDEGQRDDLECKQTYEDWEKNKLDISFYNIQPSWI
jgi:hypothetical protein